MKRKYLLEVIAKGSYYTAQEICEMENISADTFRDTIKSLGIKPATWGAKTKRYNLDLIRLMQMGLIKDTKKDTRLRKRIPLLVIYLAISKL